jgi:hypothetical protein
VIAHPERCRRASDSRSSTRARRWPDSNRVPDALMAELAEHFSDPELVELSFLIGYINMLNLFNNLLHVRYHGEYSLLRTPLAASGGG